MKGTENIRADILSQKLGYENKEKPEDFAVFRKDRDNLAINYYQIASIIRVDSDFFTDEIRAAYDNDIIDENIP
jgi:hypothetical protein